MMIAMGIENYGSATYYRNRSVCASDGGQGKAVSTKANASLGVRSTANIFDSR